jgi:uridine kinase
MKNKKPFVLAISAVSGGGKTTMITQLNECLPNSKALYFDDYEFDECPDDICEWVERGADSNEWDLSPLINDLQKLLSDTSPYEYILLDYPFAYTHNGMRQYIDYTIFIDTPLDIAMARRVIRDFKESSIDSLINDLSYYLDRSRNAYINMLMTIKPNSDFIMDGSLSTDTIVNQIHHKVMEVSKQTH